MQRDEPIRLRRAMLMAGMGFSMGGGAGLVRAEGQMTEVSARLETAWGANDSAVAVRYRVTNTGSLRIAVFDRLRMRDAAGVHHADPRAGYVTFAPEGGIVVDKMVPEIPDEIDVMNPEIAYARIVPPGGAIEGDVVLRLPVEERTAYGLQGAAIGGQSEWAMLRVGVAIIPDRWEGETPWDEETVDGEPVVLFHHAWTVMNQRVLNGERVQMRVPVAEPPR